MHLQVQLRDVWESDLAVFYEHQLDPEAKQMAAFPARNLEDFMTHWSNGLREPTTILKTIVVDGSVVGNVVAWEHSGQTNVGYWLGKQHWGQGITTAALSLFLKQVAHRPLYAHVAKHNIASIRVLQKCGFSTHEEGQYTDADGQIGKEYIMMLTQ